MSQRNEQDSFLEACWKADECEVRRLASYAKDACDSKGRSCLHFASARKDTSVLRFLLRCGADVDACDHLGATPCHVASSSGRLESLKLLHEHGCDLHGTDATDDSPLHLACRNGHPCVVSWLLQHHARAKETNADGLTPLLELLLRCASFEKVPKVATDAKERGKRILRSWYHPHEEEGGTMQGWYEEEDSQDDEDTLHCEDDAFDMADALASAEGEDIQWNVFGHHVKALADALGRKRASLWIDKRFRDPSNEPHPQASVERSSASKNGTERGSDDVVDAKEDIVSDERAERILEKALRNLRRDETFQASMQSKQVRQAVMDVAEDPRRILRWIEHPEIMNVLQKLRKVQDLRRELGARKIRLEELIDMTPRSNQVENTSKPLHDIDRFHEEARTVGTLSDHSEQQASHDAVQWKWYDSIRTKILFVFFVFVLTWIFFPITSWSRDPSSVPIHVGL